jgi:serine/threonine-protein kinase SBK
VQVVLAKCRHTGTQVALKLLPKTSTKLRDFQREFQLSYFLSPHANIIDTYNVAFETKSSFVFAQEHAALGDLFDAIPPQVRERVVLYMFPTYLCSKSFWKPLHSL